MIRIDNLSKTFKVLKRDKGLSGAFKSLFIRKYEEKHAVIDVSFHIAEGEIVGYIGANGAGKSTTIKMMCGIISPTGGSITVNGIVPQKQRVSNARNIGAVFGQRSQLNWDIPVRESFYLLSKIYSLDKQTYEQNLKFLTEVLDLEPLMKMATRQLSLGQKMRCELAAAFLHNPKIVYLDEPTIGLDVEVKAKIRQFIKDANKKYKTTVILTTHDMQDIEELCERIIIIDKGKKVYDGTIQDLKKQYFTNKNITFNTAYPVDIEKISLEEGIELVDSKEYEFTVSYDTDRFTNAQVINLIMKTTDIVDLSIQEQSIETIVKKIYKEGF